MDTAERIRRKVDVSRGHHLWSGSKDAFGNGQMRINGKLTTVRRVVWELHHGPLTSNHRVDVTCGESSCVRSAHLSVSETNSRTTSKPKFPPERRG